MRLGCYVAALQLSVSAAALLLTAAWRSMKLELDGPRRPMLQELAPAGPHMQNHFLVFSVLLRDSYGLTWTSADPLDRGSEDEGRESRLSYYLVLDLCSALQCIVRR